jgi:hypothetical protein
MLSQGINSQKVIVPERDWWPRTRVVPRDYLAAAGARNLILLEMMARNNIRIPTRSSYLQRRAVSDQDESASAFECRPGLPPLHDDPLHVFVAPS